MIAVESADNNKIIKIYKTINRNNNVSKDNEN